MDTDFTRSDDDFLENPITITELAKRKPKLSETVALLEVVDHVEFSRVTFALGAVVTKGAPPGDDVVSVCAVCGERKWLMGWCSMEDAHMLKRLAVAVGLTTKVFIRRGGESPVEIRNADIDCGKFTFA